MIPSLTSGDIVLVNHAKRNGDGVFVVRMGNALRVKRLQWLANGDLRISSDNPIYQTEQITPAELARMARDAGLSLDDCTGMSLNLLTRQYFLCDSADVNYMAMFQAA